MWLSSRVKNLNVLVSMLISGSKQIRPPSNHMDFVGRMSSFKNPSPDEPENLFTSWYKSMSDVRSKAVMCRHALKKGSKRELLGSIQTKIDAEILHDDFIKISKFYHPLILSFGKLKFQEAWRQLRKKNRLSLQSPIWAVCKLFASSMS